MFFQVCWDQTNFSKSLDSLELAAKVYLSELCTISQDTSTEKAHDLLSLSLMFVELWRHLAMSAISQKMTPAVEYLVTLSSMFSRSSSSGIFQLPSYLTILAAGQLSGDMSKSVTQRLSQHVSDQVKNKKFERIFIVPEMTHETKLFFTKELIKQLLFVHNNAIDQLQSDNCEPVLNEQEASNDNVQVEASADLSMLIEMLDIATLEFLDQRKIPEAVDLIITEFSKNKILPTSETFHLVIKVLGEIGDIYSLVSIEKMLPSENNGKEWVQETIVNSKLRSLNQNWEAGSKVESWVKLIELYRGIWDDRKNSRIPKKTGEKFLLNCRKTAKLFMEEAIIFPEADLVKPIQLGCNKVKFIWGF